MRSLLKGAVAALGTVLLVSACGGAGTTPTPATTAEAGASASATAAPTPTPTPEPVKLTYFTFSAAPDHLNPDPPMS